MPVQCQVFNFIVDYKYLLGTLRDNLIRIAIHNNFPYVVNSSDNKYNILVSGFGSVKTIFISGWDTIGFFKALQS